METPTVPSKSPTVTAIIQARMGSSRLAGKVLKRLGEQTVLEHVVDRVRACPSIDRIVVATTDTAKDNAIVQECVRLGVAVYRGSEDDVLDRYYGAACEFGGEVLVRVTSDCPLLDTPLLEQMVQAFLTSEKPLDYLSNTIVRTYPRGLDAEVFTFAALEQAAQEANHPLDREHVTPFLYRHPERFLNQQFEGSEDFSQHRWTLDTEEDWQFLEALRMRAADDWPLGFESTLRLLERYPELPQINADIEQKKLMY